MKLAIRIAFLACIFAICMAVVLLVDTTLIEGKIAVAPQAWETE